MFDFDSKIGTPFLFFFNESRTIIITSKDVSLANYSPLRVKVTGTIEIGGVSNHKYFYLTLINPCKTA